MKHLSMLVTLLALLAGSVIAQAGPQTAEDVFAGGAESLGQLQFDEPPANEGEGPQTGGGSGHGRCRPRCAWPRPHCVDRSVLPIVTPECFTVSGRCLQLVDEVRFGRACLERDGTIGRGAFRASADGDRLEICPPQCLEPGCYRVELRYRGCRVARFWVRMVTPRQPAIACDAELRAGREQCVYMHDGGQARPNTLFILISPEREPSVLPGIVELGIGNNFQNYLCGVALTGPCAVECIGVVPTSALGLKLYFQGVVFNPSGQVLPLPVTPVCETRYVE